LSRKSGQDHTNIAKGITILYARDKDMPLNAHGYLGFTQKDGPEHATLWINTEYNNPSDSASIHLHEIIQGIDLYAFTTNTASIFYLYGRPAPMQPEDKTVMECIFGIPIGYNMYGYKNDSLITGDITMDAISENSASALPEKFSLRQNYPNPFNPSTIINYQLPIGNWVTIKVYDVLGREVATLVNEVVQPGEYSVKWDASNNPGGVYYYRITTEDFTAVRKMVLVR